MVSSASFLSTTPQGEGGGRSLQQLVVELRSGRQSSRNCRWQHDGGMGDPPPASRPDSPAVAAPPHAGQVVDSLDYKWDPEERSSSLPRGVTGKMRSDFSVPELLGDPAASFPLGSDQSAEPQVVPRKVPPIAIPTHEFPRSHPSPPLPFIAVCCR